MLVFSRHSSFQMYKLEAIQFLVNSTFQFHYTGHKYLQVNLIITLSLGSIETDRVISETML